MLGFNEAIHFNSFDECELPRLSICQPDNTILEDIIQFSNLHITLCYNELSELSLNIYKYIYDNKTNSYIETNCYKWIDKYRQILISGLGYFIITEPKEVINGYGTYFEINAKSCEYEIQNRVIAFYKTTSDDEGHTNWGQYKFYTVGDKEDTIIGKFLNQNPQWSVGSIDSVVADRTALIDDTEENCYDFLHGTCEEAYRCIILFDFNHREINVIDSDKTFDFTGIDLSYDDVINNIEKQTSSNDIVTALTVKGSDNLTIEDVNPTSGNILWNFDYFKNTKWMSQSLISAIDLWTTKIQENTQNYQSVLLKWQNANANLIKLQGELSDLETKLKSDEQVQGTRVAGVGDKGTSKELQEINSTILTDKNNIASKNTEITTQTNECNSLMFQLKSIQSNLNISNNFTESQYKSLFPFIHQSTFSDDNFAIQDNMTYEEKQNEAKLLMEKGKSVLNRVSKPQLQFSVDTSNFLFQQKFSFYRKQLILGNLVRVHLDEQNFVNLNLQKVDLDYEENKLQLTFGNCYDLSDPINKWDDAFKDLSDIGSTIESERYKWAYPVNSGAINDFNKFMNSSLDATKNAMTASTIDGNKQLFTLDHRGLILTSARNNQDIGDNLNQVWLTGDTMAFSDDGFKTAKLALGEITLPDNETKAYGLIAKYLVGEMIIGSQLLIKNETGTFEVNKDGASLINLSLKCGMQDGKNQLLLSPTDGFKIQHLQDDSTWKDTVYINMDGDLVTPTLTATKEKLEVEIGDRQKQYDNLKITVDGLSNTVSSYDGKISSISQDINSINSSVSYIEDGDYFGTKISQNANSIKYAFFNGQDTSQEITMDGKGFDFYLNSSPIGHMGTNSNTYSYYGSLKWIEISATTSSAGICLRPQGGAGLYLSNSGSYQAYFGGNVKVEGTLSDNSNIDCKNLSTQGLTCTTLTIDRQGIDSYIGSRIPYIPSSDVTGGYTISTVDMNGNQVNKRFHYQNGIVISVD